MTCPPSRCVLRVTPTKNWSDERKKKRMQIITESFVLIVCTVIAKYVNCKVCFLVNRRLVMKFILYNIFRYFYASLYNFPVRLKVLTVVY